MLINKLANVTASIEDEYDPALVAAVRAAHDTCTAQLAVLDQVEALLNDAHAADDDTHDPYYHLKWEVQSQRSKFAETWRHKARSCVAQRYPSIDLDGLRGFETPREFFTALHDLHGADLGTYDREQSCREIVRRLSLDKTTVRGATATIGAKTITAPDPIYYERMPWAERLSTRSLDFLLSFERFMHDVMGEPDFRFGPSLERWGFEFKASDYFGCKLAENEGSIIRNVQLFKKGSMKITFWTEAGLRKFLRALDVEDLAEEGS